MDDVSSGSDGRANDWHLSRQTQKMNDLRVLLIEDNEDDATIILRELRRAGYEAVAERVATADGLRAALARHAWDLISCDYNLPGFSALAALALIREHDGNVPVVVVSGEIGEELTVSLIRAGADDLVLKHNLRRLPGAMEHALRDAENRRRRAAAEAALHDEARISAALARVGEECVASLETDLLLHRVCRATTEVLGCEYSHTALWNPEEGAFAVVAGHDTPEHWERVRALKLPLALVADRIAQLKQNGIVEAGPAELARDPGGVIIATAAEATASLYVPLWRGDDLIGIHAAGYRRPVEGFAPWQRRVAVGIGHLVSLALDNAHLVDRLTHADRIKSEFLSTMSHELRTPLNHIIGFNDLLLEEAAQFTAEQTDMLQTIGRSGRDLLTLVNGILDVQRLEAAPATAPEATDVAELLRELTAATSATCPSDLHVGCQLPPELPALRANPTKLKAVLQSLIDNAVKFTPRGSVTIGAEPQDDGVLFTVADTGVGIPPEVLPIIFEPFRQGDASSTRRHGGVGLGLYIVRRELERLGGQVTVESAVGGGSTFRVWIPCEQRSTTKVAADPQKDAPTLYAEILDATHDLVHTVTPDGRLLYANRAWQAALGYESDELRALSLDDIVHPQSRAELHQARQRALSGDPTDGMRVKCIAKDGRSVELEGSIRCRFANGEPIFMLCVYQNVTERAAVQRQAEARRQLLETILKALPVGVWITDEVGRIIQGNPAAQRIWGGARYVGIEEYGQYKGWFAASGKPIHADEWAAAGAIRRGETTINEELEIESFHGICRTILQSALPLRDAVGGIAGAIIVDHDITALRQMERSLRESEQRFRTLVEQAADGIFVHDLAGLIAEVNPQVCQSLGYSRDALIGRPLTDIDQQLDPERARQHLLQLESRAPLLVDTVHRRKDGSTFPVEVRSVRITWNGQPHVLGTCRDVTEHKQMEAALRETHASLEIAVMAARAGLWEWDLQTGETHYAESWRTLFGYSPAELEGSLEEWATLVHPEDLAQLTRNARAAVEATTSSYEEEFRLRHKDGTYRWVLSRASVLRDDAGTPLRMIGAHVDITDQQKTKLALQEAEASLQFAVESAKVAVWKCNLQTLTIRFSSGWKRVLGREQSTLKLTALWDLVHPDDRAKTTAVMQEHLQGRTAAYETEQRMLHADGSYRWVLSRGVVTHDTEGRPSHWFGADIDVTERKALEDALRTLTVSLEQQVTERTRELVAVNERLHLITDNMSDMLSQVSLEGVFQYVSPAHERILGYAPQQMLGKSVLEFLDPDDVAAVTATIKATINRAATGTAEFRYRHADGHYVWLETVGKLLFDDHGAPFGAVLNGRDVTERKRAEESLQESQAFIASLIQTIPFGMDIVDEDGKVLFLNPAMERAVGRPGLGERCWHLYKDDRQQCATCPLERHLKVGETASLESVGVLGGRTFEITHTGMTYRGKQAVLEVFYDITDLKRVADALRESEERFRNLNAELEQHVDERTAQLEAANKDLEAFSYSVSHDLRAPLRHIEGFSKMLLEDYTVKLDDEGRRYLDRIQAGCLRMGQLIDDLLALSRVSRQPLRRERIDLSALARSVTAELQAANSERTVDVVLADGIIAPGDPSLLRIVLENLLGNAWKYSAKRAHARIELGKANKGLGATPDPQPPTPVFFVRDNGAGFDPAHSDKLFAPFQRLHSPAEFEGTGIGLAIVARIVRRHGGDVWAEGAVDQGATFYFTLGDSSSVASV
jgi:PAS domain S-box-containing protein